MYLLYRLIGIKIQPQKGRLKILVSKLWQLSLKMLLVKKGRTFFSIIAIAISVGLLCSMFLLHMMFNQDLQQRLENEYGSADIRISSPPPTSGNEWSGLDTSILEDLSDIDQIQSIGRALEGKVGGRILYENQSAIIDDADFHYVGVDNEKITKEYYKFEQDLSDYEVALSESLADHWNVGVSDSIEIDLLDGNNVVWKVAEVVQPTQNKAESSEDWIFFHLGSLQEVMGLSEMVNPILVELDPKANLSFIANDLIEQLPENIRLDSLYGLEEEEEQSIFFRVYGYILSVIAFMASITLVYGMMQTTFRERLGELAVIRAVGGSPQQLMKMVFFEWTFISTIGSLLGFSLAWFFGVRGIEWASGLFNLELIIKDESGGSLGMLLIALLSWLVILLASLGIVRKVSQTDPVQSFRESSDSRDGKSGGNMWWIICAVTGFLLWLISFFLSDTSYPDLSYKVLFSMLGGLLLITTLLGRIVRLGGVLLRLMTLLPQWIVSRSFKLSAQRLLVEKVQLFSVILMAIVITVYIPVATLFQFMDSPDTVTRAEQFNADFLLSAHHEQFKSTEMPWYLKHEMEKKEWVEEVLPLPSTQLAEINGNNSLDSSISENQQLIWYGVTDLRVLAEWNLASFPDDVLDNAGVLPKPLANELGIEIGDSLSLIIDGQPTSIVIADIPNEMDALPHYQNVLFIDERHPGVQTGGLIDLFVKVGDRNQDQMIQELGLLQRVYPEMRWIEKGEAVSAFETTRQQALAMLQGITILVMVGGIGGMLNAVNAGIHARRREYAVLRSIYVTPFQMMKLIAWQGVILSALSLLIGSITASVLLFSIYNSSSGFHGIFENIPFGNIGVLYIILFLLSVLSTIPMAGKIARMKIMDIFKTGG